MLNNFLNNLDERWNFLLVCGKLNKEFLIDLITSDFENHKDRITIYQIDVENFTVSDYSYYMTCTHVYHLIPTEIFLVFQLDTLISNKYKDHIYGFLKYDYVGAPWNHHLVGNGGLSLRKKSIVLDVINKFPPYYPEDFYFSEHIKNKPTFEEAKLFSIETVFSEKSFGIHKCWMFLDRKELEKVSQYIPELFGLIEIYEPRYFLE